MWTKHITDTVLIEALLVIADVWYCCQWQVVALDRFDRIFSLKSPPYWPIMPEVSAKSLLGHPNQHCAQSLLNIHLNWTSVFIWLRSISLRVSYDLIQEVIIWASTFSCMLNLSKKAGQSGHTASNGLHEPLFHIRKDKPYLINLISHSGIEASNGSSQLRRTLWQIMLSKIHRCPSNLPPAW